MSAPVGREGREDVTLLLGDDPVNALVAGVAGSGKSNLLRSFIYGLARRYDTADVQMYLLDFKEGVEFQEFAPHRTDMTFLPHAAVVSVNSSREFGVEVLRHLTEIVKERYALFNAHGSAPKLESLRQRVPELHLPRILLVVDEFQRLFDTNDALATDATTELVNLAKQGRAAGVHFVLATQSIADVGAGTSVGSRLDGIFKNAGLRIGMRLSESESRQIFSSASNTAAAEIHEAGVAIVNASGGNEAFNRRTQVALLSHEAAKLERQEAVAQTAHGRIPPRTFDGAVGADAAANRKLRKALRGRTPDGAWETWPAQSLHVDRDDPRATIALRLAFPQERRRNLAIVGAGLASAVSIAQWAAVGLAATRPDAGFLLVDLLRPDDASEHGVPAGTVAATAAVMERLGAKATLLTHPTASELLERHRAFGEKQAGSGAVLVFGHVDRMRGLADPLEPGGFETVAAHLAKRLGEAPNDGIHTVAAFGAREDFEELDDRGQTFGQRMYLQMPESALRQLSGGDVVPPTAPLALWHDVAQGTSIRTAHLYEPFGSASIPDWLAR